MLMAGPGNGILLELILFSLVSGYLVNANVITTRLGALEGLKKVARNGKIFHAYYGIPYAKPPIGRLRFEPPTETEPWTGVFNATQTPSWCPQHSKDEHTPFVGQEDCLYVNVFTPSHAKSGTNIPVLFYIFGGQFDHGNAFKFGPEFLMSRNITLVIVSYRLGALGFLSTGDDVIPGNMGLRDQAMAMKWTRENIDDYGGDPRRITIYGHSSGSMSVHAHTMSPLSRDYFDQAIMQSGFIGPNNFWDLDYASTYARDFGRLVNCPTEPTKLFKLCLQSKTARELVLVAEETFIWNKLETTRFRPVIEDDRVINAFLNKSHFLDPYSSTPKKPWLLGMTTGEAALTVGGYLHPDSSAINIDLKLLFPTVGYFQWTSKLNHVDFIVRWLKTRFFGEEEVRNTTDIVDIALVKMLNGILYGHNLIDVVQKYGGPKYLYLMDFRYAGGYTGSKGGLGGRYLGLAHADELNIIFKIKNPDGIADEDFAFGDEIITRWVNFAYSGNPNRPFAINTSVFGPWSAVSSPRMEFLRIKRHGSMEMDYFLQEYAIIWRRIPIFSKYLAE